MATIALFVWLSIICIALVHFRRPLPACPASWTILYSPAPEVAAPATTRTKSARRSTSLAPVSVSNNFRA